MPKLVHCLLKLSNRVFLLSLARSFMRYFMRSYTRCTLQATVLWARLPRLRHGLCEARTQ